MKHYPEHPLNPLLPELSQQLAIFRNQRNFKAEEYLILKSGLLVSYFKKYGLTSAVVAVSGGIDSAVVLGILNYTQKNFGVPSEIYPVLMPAFNKGVTNQDLATLRGKEVCAAFNQFPRVINLTAPHQNLKIAVEESAGLNGKSWAVGQLVPYIRTPSLYYYTSLLSEQGKKAVVCGTTNQDEGLYLGYFGKASDGLVDLQVISDLHKSEIFKLAQTLHVPESVLKVAPNGDMFDNRTDEEVFGASYDFVELFLREKQAINSSWVNSLSLSAKKQWEQGCKNLETLHQYNRHKYLGHSPAVHFDLWKTFCEDGWKHNSNESIPAPQLPLNKIVNLQKLELVGGLCHPLETLFTRHATVLKKTLSPELIASILKELSLNSWVPAGINGYTANLENGVGSLRQSFFSPVLSSKLAEEIKRAVPLIRFEDGVWWRLSSVSELFRAIKYPAGGRLVPHYDAPFVFQKGKKTLQSVVISLQDSARGGATRFIKDETPDPEFKDWTRVAEPEEIDSTFNLTPGDVLCFPHRQLHDGEKIYEGEKIVLRTDLVYEEICW